MPPDSLHDQSLQHLTKSGFGTGTLIFFGVDVEIERSQPAGAARP
jgi:hypothetical protein